jgi:hypothetical protein
MASCKGLGREGGAPAPHVLAVDDSSVDRAVIASILRSSKFRGELLIRSWSTSKCFVFFSLVPGPESFVCSMCSDRRRQREEGAGAAGRGTCLAALSLRVSSFVFCVGF